MNNFKRLLEKKEGFVELYYKFLHGEYPKDSLKNDVAKLVQKGDDFEKIEKQILKKTKGEFKPNDALNDLRNYVASARGFSKGTGKAKGKHGTNKMRDFDKFKGV